MDNTTKFMHHDKVVEEFQGLIPVFVGMEFHDLKAEKKYNVKGSKLNYLASASTNEDGQPSISQVVILEEPRPLRF